MGLQPGGADEYIEIKNYGPDAADLTGWWICSVVGGEWYGFPEGYILQAGASVRVHSGPEATLNPPSDLGWSEAHIWDDGGDRAELWDAHENVVDVWAYGVLPQREPKK